MKPAELARPMLVLALLLLASLWASEPVLAQDQAPQPPAQTEAQADTQAAPQDPAFDPALTNPDTPPEIFDMLLLPLTRDELAALGADWQGIVRDQTEDLVEARVAALTGGSEPDAARIDTITRTREALFNKYSSVIDQWEKKGGDAAEIETYRTYRRAIAIEEQRTASIPTLARQAWEWGIDREGGLHFVIQAGVIVGALLVLGIVAGTVRRLSRRWVGRIPNLSKLLQAFIVMLVYWITIAIGLMIVLSSLGIDITPVFALIGGASFIIAFAMQDTLGNLAAGLMIMINHPFDEGDYVDIGGVAGTVKSVSIVSTTVVTPDNQVIVVPNSKVWGNVITNVTASPTRRVDLTFGIGYGDSIEDAQRVLEQIVEAHPLILADPAPVIRVNALGASSVDFVCRPWVKGSDYWTVFWDLTRQVKLAFDENGISIPFPQTDMHIHMEGMASSPFPPPAAHRAELAGSTATVGATPADRYAAGDEANDDDAER